MFNYLFNFKIILHLLPLDIFYLYLMDILNSQWADPVDGLILYLTLLDQTMDKELVSIRMGNTREMPPQKILPHHQIHQLGELLLVDYLMVIMLQFKWMNYYFSTRL